MARASMTLKLEGVAAVQDVIAELHAALERARTIAVALEQENHKLTTALTTVLDILGDPADDEACARRCLGPQVIARLREAL